MSTQSLSDRRAGLDVVLTNLSLGISRDQTLIGDRILPSLMRPTSTTTIGVWGNEAFRSREDKVGDYSEPDKLDVSIDKTTFEIDGHALMAPISDRHQLESIRGPLQVDLDAEAVATVRYSMDLQREKHQAAVVTSATSYNTSSPSGANHVVDLNSPNHQWDNSANDPLDDILPAIEILIDDAGLEPTLMWMGRKVFTGLMTNSKVRDRLFGTTGPQPVPTLAQLEGLLGLRILVGNAGTRAEDGTISKLWGKSAGFLYVPPSAGARIPAFGYTVEQSVFGGGSEAVVRIRDEKMGASGGSWIKRSSFYTATVLFKDAGFLFENAVA